MNFSTFKNNEFYKLMKSRLNKDGFALIDAIVAFTILTIAVTLILGFMSTAIRTSPIIESDAEDQQATMIAVSQAIAKTSSVQQLSFNLTSYVPSRSLTDPSTLKLYDNYDSQADKLVGSGSETIELLTKNVIPSSSMSIYIHPTSNQWIQKVMTTKAKGAVFTMEPVSNIITDNQVPSNAGFFNVYRVEEQRSRLKHIDTLNYPKSYIESEMLIYENTIK